MKKPYGLSMKAVIVNSENKCLLLKRALNSGANALKWDLPGGKIDAGEDFHDGLIREIYEETGLSVEIDGVLDSSEAETPNKKIAYLIMYGHSNSTSVKLSEEHEACLWANVNELAELDLVEHFRACLSKYYSN